MANGKFLVGDGTKANPYLVEDLADLKALNSLTASSYPGDFKLFFKQTADIDCAGNAFSNGFKCAGYDGNGKVLNNLSIVTDPAMTWRASPFYVGEIKNVRIANGYVYGRIAIGLLEGDYSEIACTLENCTFEGTVEGIDRAYGMVEAQYYANSSFNLTGFREYVKNCRFNGTVKVTPTGTDSGLRKLVSGIAGMVDGVDISDSHFEGTLSCPYLPSPTNDAKIGGILLDSDGDDTVKNCTVKATISSKMAGVLGGIVANIWGNGAVTNCHAEGTFTNELGNIGGVVGFLTSGGNVSGSTFTGSATGYRQVGGITAGMDGTTVISDCVATADLVSQGRYVGGISGIMTAQANILNSTSYGTVKGSNHVTGITTAFGDNVPYTSKSMVTKITLVPASASDVNFAEHSYSTNAPIPSDDLAKFRAGIELVGCSHASMDAYNGAVYRKGTPIV